VGSHRGMPVEVRIIAATSRELSREVEAGRFRLDLYYRLNVVKLTTLPLNRRPEDIAPLCRCFLDRWSVENGLPRKRVSAAALRVLTACDWPGNVRQLQNVLERVAVFGEGEEITPGQIEDALEGEIPAAAAAPTAERDEDLPSDTHPCRACNLAGPACCTARRDTWPTLQECESRLIRETLERTYFNQSAAARLLGVDWRLLARKMQKYGIANPRSRLRRAG
jgi:DNA-binding NtrC family response regulator